MEPPLDEIFTRRSKSKRCVVCSDAFIPKVRGGKQQKLCGKTSCDRELRKQREVGRRKLKRTA